MGHKRNLREIKHAIVGAYRFYDFVLMPKVLRKGGWSCLNSEERLDYWIDYSNKIVSELGISDDEDLSLEILDALFDRKKYRRLPDADRALKELDQLGMPLGIISNWDDTLESVLVDTSMREFFEVIVTSTSTGYEKPDKRIFLAALSMQGVDPSEALYVGDELVSDVLGVRKVGMDSILVDRKNVYYDISCKKIRRLDQIVGML